MSELHDAIDLEAKGRERVIELALKVERQRDCLLEVCRKALAWADKALPPTLCELRHALRIAIAKAEGMI